MRRERLEYLAKRGDQEAIKALARLDLRRSTRAVQHPSRFTAFLRAGCGIMYGSLNGCGFGDGFGEGNGDNVADIGGGGCGNGLSYGEESIYEYNHGYGYYAPCRQRFGDGHKGDGNGSGVGRG